MDKYIDHHRHTPSGARGHFKSWWNFLAGEKQLYDHYTNTAKCSVCGHMLRIPAQYSKIMPVYAYSCGLGTMTLSLIFLRTLRERTTISIYFIMGLVALFGICAYQLTLKMNKAYLLCTNEWIELSVQLDGNSSQILHEEAIADNRRIRHAGLSGLAAAAIIIRLFI